MVVQRATIRLVDLDSPLGGVDKHCRVEVRPSGADRSLIAEATGVGYGLGQIIMLARNTFNPSLVFFTIVLIGITGFCFDYALRLLQVKLLYWVPKGQGALG